MLYALDMADRQRRASTGLAIVAAFAGQAAVLAVLVALATVAAGGAPALVKGSSQAPAVSAPATLPPAYPLRLPGTTRIPYTVSAGGQSRTGAIPGVLLVLAGSTQRCVTINPGAGPPPALTARPGQAVTIRLGITVPPGVVLTGLSLFIAGDQPGPATVLFSTARPVTSGTHGYVVTWRPSPGQLAPGHMTLGVSIPRCSGFAGGGSSPVATLAG
jgi:hypothetical protein